MLEPRNSKRGRLGFIFIFIGIGLALCVTLCVALFLGTRILSEFFPQPTPTRVAIATSTPTRVALLPTSTPKPKPTSARTSTMIPLPTSTPLPTRTRLPARTLPPTVPATWTPIVITTPPGPTQTPWVVTATPLPPSPTALPSPIATLAPTVQAELDITYPGEIYFEKVGSVTVMIVPLPQIAFIPPFGSTAGGALFSIETTTQEGNRKTVSEQIRMFPYMLADLRAPNFDVVQSKADQWQPIVLSRPAVWTWDLNPKKVGTQIFTVDMFGSDVITGELRIFVKQYKREIEVLDKPPLQKLSDYIGANFVPLLGTILGSLGGSGFLFWFFTQRRKKKR
jgi:hypothetical protein